MYKTIFTIGIAAAFTVNSQTIITPPAKSVEILRAHAVGYQVYACEAGGKWSGAEPIAALVTPNGNIIRHYRDQSPVAPAWEAADGSKVNAVLTGGKPDQSVPSSIPNSIPRLGLNAKPAAATGTFGKVSYVIRANTTGGVKPPEPCQPTPSKRIAVKYEADYMFYRAY